MHWILHCPTQVCLYYCSPTQTEPMVSFHSDCLHGVMHDILYHHTLCECHCSLLCFTMHYSLRSAQTNAWYCIIIVHCSFQSKCMHCTVFDYRYKWRHYFHRRLKDKTSPLNSQSSPSVRATGGVYKGQGRIPGGLLNQRPVQGIPSWDRDQQLAMVCPDHELNRARDIIILIRRQLLLIT